MRSSNDPPSGGARHEALDTNSRGREILFRPDRVNARQLRGEATCTFVLENESLGPFRLLNLSEFGFAFAAPGSLELWHGARLDEVSIRLESQPYWQGAAMVAHVREGEPTVVGVRLLTGLLDLRQIETGRPYRSDPVAQLELEAWDQLDRLPATWRVLVGDLRVLLMRLANHLDVLDDTGPRRSLEQEMALIAAVKDSWGDRYSEQLQRLYRASQTLEPEALPLARSYATAHLLDLVRRCPLHRRAADKPFGYAGDYVLIEGYFDTVPEADTLFGRLLRTTTQDFGLVRAVLARERYLRDTIADVAKRAGDAPVCIVSLGSGPAMEVRRFGLATEHPRPSLRFVLIDQDRDALQHCHRELNRIFIDRFAGEPAFDLDFLRVTIRQLLRARETDEIRLVRETIGEANLVYASGLFDYLPHAVAGRLLQRLYDTLAPGGRLVVGNFKIAEDSVWLLDFVLAWHLIYRTPEDMRALASELSPPPTRVELNTDSTGYCLMLDITHP